MQLDVLSSLFYAFPGRHAFSLKGGAVASGLFQLARPVLDDSATPTGPRIRKETQPDMGNVWALSLPNTKVEMTCWTGYTAHNKNSTRQQGA